MPRELPTEETNSLVNTPEMEGYKQTKLGWIPVDWEVKLLGEFFEFKNGLNKGKEFFGYGTPIINYMDVNKKDSLRLDDIKGKVSLSESEIQRFNIKKGDVFFTRTSETIDEIAYSTVLIEDVKDGVFSGFILRARPRKLGELDINFTRYCFSTHIARKEIMSKSTFTTRALTNGRFLSEVNLLIPPLPEQQKIAQILNIWDKAIALQEQLIAEKQALKKGLMQELLTGKKRFPGFDEEWEEAKLGEICNFTQGIQIPYSEQINYYKSGYVRYLYIRDFFSDVFKCYVLDNYPKKIMTEDDIMMVNTGNTAGKVFKGAKGVLSNNAFKVSPKKGLSKQFLYYLLSSEFTQHKVKSFFNYGGQPHVGHKNVARIPIRFPSINEQNIIVQAIDNFMIEVEILEKNVKKLKIQKQGLMHQLLTGEKQVEI